jgi:hypothetical protein
MVREWQTREPGAAGGDNLSHGVGVSRRDRRRGGRRRRRALVALLLGLGSAAALVGSFAVWLDRQALSPGGWQTTSSQLIASPPIRRGVGTFAVSELYARTNVAGALHSALPPALAEPALRTLRSLGLRLAGGILATPAARRVWNTANRQAHRDLLEIIDHGGRRGTVALNLRPLLVDLVRALAASAPVRAIPGGRQLFALGSPHAGEIPILRADQVDRVRGAVKAVRGLSVALLGAAVLFALAVASASGWRSIAVRRVGYCLLAIGALILLARRVLAPALADALVSAASYRRAAGAAWTIATTELRDVAVAILIAGGVLVLAGLATRAVIGDPRRGRPA